MSKGDWISIKGELPAIDQDGLFETKRSVRVLVFAEFVGITTAHLVNSTFGTYWSEGSGYGSVNGVTHWRHLPKEPEDS